MQQRPTNAKERISVADAHVRLGILQAIQQDRVGAESEAASALITLQCANKRERIDDYKLQHNLACIYGELSKWDEPNCDQFQRKALRLLEKALQLGEDVNEKPKEIKNIGVEPAFKSLLTLPGYLRLLE